MLKWRWEGDVMHLSGPGAKATIALEDGRLVGRARARAPGQPDAPGHRAEDRQGDAEGVGRLDFLTPPREDGSPVAHLPNTLPAAVRRHAAVHPHAPWLFERPELDWLWILLRGRRPTGSPSLPEPRRSGLGRPPCSTTSNWPCPMRTSPVPPPSRTASAPPEIRDILVSGRPLSDPAEHRLLAWATLTGAAILFEPDPAAYVPAAAWARPTVFQGTAAEIAALRREAGSRSAPPGPAAAPACRSAGCGRSSLSNRCRRRTRLSGPAAARRSSSRAERAEPRPKPQRGIPVSGHI